MKVGPLGQVGWIDSVEKGLRAMAVDSPRDERVQGPATSAKLVHCCPRGKEGVSESGNVNIGRLFSQNGVVVLLRPYRLIISLRVGLGVDVQVTPSSFDTAIASPSQPLLYGWFQVMGK